MGYANPNYNAEYKAKNKEKIAAQNAKRYQEKKEHILELNRKWRETNREKRQEIDRLYRENNRSYMAEKESRRRASKINATPSWLTEEDKIAIEKIYEYAWSLGYHVDHIVPLRNKKVCGLHVPWNLQPIPAEDNMRKHNKFEVI